MLRNSCKKTSLNKIAMGGMVSQTGKSLRNTGEGAYRFPWSKGEGKLEGKIGNKVEHKQKGRGSALEKRR